MDAQTKAATVPKLRVLVVDDNDVDRKAVRRALAKGGIEAEVNEAVDFESARQAMLSGYLDCILYDSALSGGDGLEILRAAREAQVDSPVVMLTGHGDDAKALDFLRQGADDYLPKSQLSPERLAQSVRRVLRVRDAERRERDAHRALQRQAAQMRKLAELSVQIHSAPSVEEGLERTARAARSLIGARMAVTLLLADSSGVPFVRVALADPETRLAAQAVAIDTSEALLLEWGLSLHLTEVQIQNDPNWKRLRSFASPGQATRGLLAARLTNREGRSAGCVLLLDSEASDFSSGDEAILVQLVRTASVALENARLYRTAQDATRARDDVLAIVSHDLRNPLNTVSMSAALLRDNLTADKTDSALSSVSLVERIERGAGRMQALIEDLLEATRIDTGKLSIAPTRERGASLVREAIESVSTLAEARKIRIQTARVDPKVFVLADRNRIFQLFSNLLGNSLKFTPSGAAITLGLERVGSEACFVVADEGAGIEPKHLAHLFERYFRANEASRDGAGLGLFIARGIVEKHGGRIAVESEVGRGTVVRFWLPVAPAAP